MQIAVCRHKPSVAHKTALLSASKVSVAKRMESTEPNPAMIKNEITLAPQGDGTFRVNFVQPPFTMHKCEGPNNYSTTSKDELMKFYKQMSTIRRIEVVADNLYKQRLVRGFLHLYNGQEAIVSGYEANMTKADHVITAYRDHGHMYGRGGTPFEIFAELLGKFGGCAHGKGGSMHMYKADANFWGGNGIVGAQVPVGAGLAFAAKYLNTGGVSLSFYGDGAANQGQIFEAFNMAALWHLPAIFVCENNKYGMGTSMQRSSADTNYFSRGDFLPGIKISANNVYAVKEGVRFAMDWARKKGPIVLEMETYRHYGHSMSDPGVSYRSREEVQVYKNTRDPIDKVKLLMLEYKLTTEDELKTIEKEIRTEVEAASNKAKEAPFPADKELYSDVYSKSSGSYFMRTVDPEDSHVVKNN